jgi:cupin fold WbuC family metalloprotein
MKETDMLTNNMSTMEARNTDVFVSTEKYPSVGRSQIELLRDNVHETSRGRIRLCVHKTNEERLHEMFIVFGEGNYIRPSKHLGKDESLHVLEGAGDYFFFDDQGRVIDSVSLGTYDSGYQFYCRIPELQEHDLLLRSAGIAIHETTLGPFRLEDTIFCPWSPEETDTSGAQRFMEKLHSYPRQERPLLKMERTGPEVFVASEHIVSVGKKEMDFLKSVVPTTERKRIRLCAHKDLENGLHEMFVVYTNMTYVKPNKHIDKDESLHILEGEADFFFFDESGNITDIIPLGDYNSGRQFYMRVPAFAWHSMVMKTDTLVIHETIPGPFRREDTAWAPWAPMETDRAAVEQFINQMRSASAAIK